MTKSDRAVELFMTGLNCAQAVFCAFAGDFGIDFETAKKISVGLGGGVGRMREVCGTVTGGAMALGLFRGDGDKAAAYPDVQAFCERFRRENGSIVCRELLAGVKATAGGAPEARTPEYYRKRPCVELVRMSAAFVEEELMLDRAAKCLSEGGVAVIPTDTVYGLAAHPAFPEAVSRLYTIKARAEGKPIALLASDADAVGKFLGHPLEGRAKELAEAHWPGALTLVTGGEGFRVPDHDWTRRLLARLGGVLRVTSANMSGARPAPAAEGALAEVGLKADLVVDGGVSKGGVPSTVVRVIDGGAVEVLREGAVKI